MDFPVFRLNNDLYILSSFIFLYKNFPVIGKTFNFIINKEIK